MSLSHRAIKVENNQKLLDEISSKVGHIIIDIRSALDYAYLDIVKKALPAGANTRPAQFPFSTTAAKIEESAKNRLAEKVSETFLRLIVDKIEPYPSGDELLYAIHELDIQRKHKNPIQMIGIKQIKSDIIHKYAPDFPMGPGSDITIGGFYDVGDIEWYVDIAGLKYIGRPIYPTYPVYIIVLPIDVKVALQRFAHLPNEDAICMMNSMVNKAEAVIGMIRAHSVGNATRNR